MEGIEVAEEPSDTAGMSPTDAVRHLIKERRRMLAPCPKHMRRFKRTGSLTVYQFRFSDENVRRVVYGMYMRGDGISPLSHQTVSNLMLKYKDGPAKAPVMLGFVAFKMNKPDTGCPWKDGTIEWYEWIRGYYFAKNEKRRNDYIHVPCPDYDEEDDE